MQDINWQQIIRRLGLGHTGSPRAQEPQAPKQPERNLGGTATPSAALAPRRKIPQPPADFDFDERQGLFVIGSARSGTTLLAETLNLSPQVFLLEEAFLYRDAKEPEFCSFFNRRHREYGNYKAKGRYLPYFGGREHTAWDLLCLLAQRYRYVGEKVAMGPWIDWDEALLEFQGAYFYHAHYVLTFRRPTEVVWSMVKKFRENPPRHHLQCWLRAFRVCVDFLATFPRVYAVFHDRFSKAYLERLCEKLEISAPIPDRMITPREQLPSFLEENALPEPLRPLEPWLNRAQEMYAELQEIISSETFAYCGEYRVRDYYHKFREQAGTIEEELQQWVSSHHQSAEAA